MPLKHVEKPRLPYDLRMVIATRIVCYLDSSFQAFESKTRGILHSSILRPLAPICNSASFLRGHRSLVTDAIPILFLQFFF